MINYDKNVLKELRKVYGSKNQISVAVEELCELSSALCKFIRYERQDIAVAKTKEAVLDEYCDVIVIQDHIKAIYCFTDDEINAHLEKKIGRCEKWLNTDTPMETVNSMETTTKIRDL